MKKTLNELTFGDIVWAKNNPGFNGQKPHPVLFIRIRNEDYFEGFALTTKKPPRFPKNVELKKEHLNYLGVHVETQSFMIEGMSFLKKTEWGDFEKVAELNSKGQGFIKSIIEGQDNNINTYSQFKKRGRP